MIGFVILSHGEPRQLQRLTRTLNRLYDYPPIACHHDFEKSRLDASEFENTEFVEPPVRTGWGKWSLVQATLLALELLYDKADPAWFVLLSASDYPVTAPNEVLNDLATSKADVLMDYRRLPAVGMAENVPGSSPCHAQHGNEKNTMLARNRYLRPIAKIPVLRKGPWPPDRDDGAATRLRMGAHTVNLPLPPLLSPFRKDFDCYYGSQWFTARKEVAQNLLSPSPLAKRLARYLRWRVVPDEAYFHSLLINEGHFRIDPDPRRYTHWSGEGWGPATMNWDTLTEAIEMRAHFARKFALDSPLLDYLDERLV